MIYYNVIGDHQLEVTVRGMGGYQYLDEYVGNVSIPKDVVYNGETYSVVSIGYCAFYYNKNLKSVTIPNSVTTINGNAFYECSSLTSVTIPK